MKMSRKPYVYAVLLCVTALLAGWTVTRHYRQREQASILIACGDFAALLNAGDVDGAYASMTADAREKWTCERISRTYLFTNPMSLLAPARKLHVNPITRSAAVIFSTADLNLPMWLEDGFQAARLDLAKRDGVWRVDHTMGIGR